MMAPILRALPIVVSILGLMLVPLSAARAQGTPPASQSASPAAAAAAAFLADPASLLARYPLGGGAMVSEVRDLVVADLKTVDALLSLAASATPDQKNAIGAGLGLAALVLLRSNPQAGTIIQDAVVKLNDPMLLAAYAAVTGNTRLAAAGPGGGGGAGSAGAGEAATGASSLGGFIAGTSSLFANFGTINPADTFTFPSLTAGTPGTTTTVTTFVSP